MTKRVLFAATAASIAFAAGAAGAATYDVSRENQGSYFKLTNDNPIITSAVRSGNTVTSQMGGYALEAKNDDGDVWNFIGWCIDLLNPLKQGSDYNTNLEIATYNASDTQPASLLGSGNLGLVEQLFEAVYVDTIVDDRIQAAGFQLAIWELLYENAGSYNVNPDEANSGDFYAEAYAGFTYNNTFYGSSSADQQLAWDAANGFLMRLNDAPIADYDFTYFTDVDASDPSQALITPTPTSVVPLPAPALMLLGGLGAMAFLRRRKT